MRVPQTKSFQDSLLNVPEKNIKVGMENDTTSLYYYIAAT